MTVYNFDPKSAFPGEENLDDENLDDDNLDDDNLQDDDTIMSEKDIRFPKQVDGTPEVPILEGSFNGKNKSSTKNKTTASTTKTKRNCRKSQMGEKKRGQEKKKRGRSQEKEPKETKKKSREVDAIHFHPRTDVKNGHNVGIMKRVPIAFHYEPKPKPHNLSEQWLELVVDKLIVQKKTKRQEEQQKEVWIKEYEQPREYYEYEVMTNIKNLVDSEDRAKELYDQISEAPDDFRFLELSKPEKRKIDKKIDKLDDVIDRKFDFVEIIRVPDPSDPLKSNPFTGIFPYF